jgi:Ca2+-binding RTX toxin-like protein
VTIAAAPGDTTPPGAPVIASVTDDLAPLVGVIAPGSGTDDTTPTLAGTAEAGATVRIFDGATQIGSTTADGAGAWSFTTPALAGGAHSFTATATDAADNTGPASAAYPITIQADPADTTAPPAPVIATVTDDFGPVTGAVPPDGPTDDRTLAVSGSAEPGSTVRVYAGATLVGTTTADGAGAWGLTTAVLTPGELVLTARATDAALNTGPASAAYPVSLINVVTGTSGDDSIVGIAGRDSLSGLAGNDTLVGGDGPDTLAGGEGNDWLWGGGADDALDGGAGVDFAGFAGLRSAFTLSYAAGAGSVASAAQGNDTFSGIERVQFNDQAIAYDTAPGQSAFEAYALLYLWLDRAPSGAELAYWSSVRDGVADLAALAQQALEAYAPGIGNEALVSRLWLNLFGAPIPADALALYAGLIVDGTYTQATLTALAVQRPENTDAFAAAIAPGVTMAPWTLGWSGADALAGTGFADLLLGRAGADTLSGAAGDDWVDGGEAIDLARYAVARAQAVIGREGAVATVAAAGLGTDRLTHTERLKFDDAAVAIDTLAGGNAYEVVALFQVGFNRLPTLAELSQWLPLRDAGTDMAGVASAMIAAYAPGVSTAALVEYLYVQLFGATPTQAQIDAYVAMIPGTFPNQGALTAAAALLEVNVAEFAPLIVNGIAIDPALYP